MSFLMENWQNLELASIRVGFGEGLVDIAKKNNLVLSQLFLQSQQTTVSFHKLWMKMATNWTH
jgi:hypothetical protein